MAGDDAAVAAEMSRSSGESARLCMWTTGEGGKEGTCSRGGRSELERRLPRDLRVRAGRMFVEEARCLLEGGGARLAMLCAEAVEEERERAGREEVDQVRRASKSAAALAARQAHTGDV